MTTTLGKSFPRPSPRRAMKSGQDVLRERLKWNVRKKEGITNRVIDNFCRMACSSDFKGVYSADAIPENKLIIRGNFIIIVNLGKRREYLRQRRRLPVGHFVAIIARPDVIYYLDPYGLPSLEPLVTTFLQSCKRPVVHNSRQVQHLDSVYCGLYAMLFATYFDKDAPFTMDFKKKQLFENDDLCVSYLHRLYSFRR